MTVLEKLSARATLSELLNPLPVSTQMDIAVDYDLQKLKNSDYTLVISLKGGLGLRHYGFSQEDESVRLFEHQMGLMGGAGILLIILLVVLVKHGSLNRNIKVDFYGEEGWCAFFLRDGVAYYWHASPIHLPLMSKWAFLKQDRRRISSWGNRFNQSGGPLLFNHPKRIASDGSVFMMADGNNNRVLLGDTLPTDNVEPSLVFGQPI